MFCFVTAIWDYQGPEVDRVISISLRFVDTYFKLKKKYKDNPKSWPIPPLKKSYKIAKQLLEDFPDPIFKEKFLHAVKNGWTIGFEGSFKDLHRKPNSFVTNINQYVQVMEKFVNELETGKVFPKPSSILMRYVFSVFCVDKKPNKDGIMQYRVISNGSKSSKFSASLNSGIPDKNAYVSLSQFMDYVHFFRFCNFMSLDDLTKSFRQQHTCFRDLSLACYSFLGLPLVDGRQPMGIRSSTANMQQLANTLVWIVKNKLLTVDKRFWTILFHCLLAYVDDYVCAHATYDGCLTLQKCLHHCADLLGLEFNKAKSVPPSTIGECHGYLWNLPLKLVGLSEKRHTKLLNLLTAFLRYNWCTARAAFSLTGQIMGYSFIVPEAKSCVHSLVQLIYTKLDKKCGSKIPPTAILHIHSRIKFHLKLWYKLLLKNRFCSFTRILQQPSFVYTIATDACNVGFGIFVNDTHRYAAVRFNAAQIPLHINIKEAYAAIVAVYTFVPFFTGRDVKFLIDNTSVVQSFAHKWSTSIDLMAMVFELSLLATKFRFRFFVDWIASKDNCFADALSRFDWKKLQQLSMSFFDSPFHVSCINTKIIEPKYLTYFHD